MLSKVCIQSEITENETRVTRDKGVLFALGKGAMGKKTLEAVTIFEERKKSPKYFFFHFIC